MGSHYTKQCTDESFYSETKEKCIKGRFPVTQKLLNVNIYVFTDVKEMCTEQ